MPSPRSATARPAFTKSSPPTTASRASRSTPRTASTARPATSRIPRRTSTGPCRRAAAGPTTPTCDHSPYASHPPRAAVGSAAAPPPARRAAEQRSPSRSSAQASPAVGRSPLADPAQRPLSRRPRRRAGPRLRHRRRPVRPGAGPVAGRPRARSTTPSACASMPAASTQAAQLAPQLLTAKPGDGFANLVMAVQQIKRGDYRAAEQQIGKIGGENQLGPLRDFVVAWLRAGQKDFAAARAALGQAEVGRRQRTEAPVIVIDAADRRDGGRQGGGRDQVPPRRRARSLGAARGAERGRRPAPARQGRRCARDPEDLRRQVRRHRRDGRAARHPTRRCPSRRRPPPASPRSCSRSAAP